MRWVGVCGGGGGGGGFHPCEAAVFGFFAFIGFPLGAFFRGEEEIADIFEDGVDAGDEDEGIGEVAEAAEGEADGAGDEEFRLDA